nr:hypothetical protein [Ideonella sp. A 288]
MDLLLKRRRACIPHAQKGKRRFRCDPRLDSQCPEMLAQRLELCIVEIKSRHCCGKPSSVS